MCSPVSDSPSCISPDLGICPDIDSYCGPWAGSPFLYTFTPGGARGYLSKEYEQHSPQTLCFPHGPDPWQTFRDPEQVLWGTAGLDVVLE